MFPTGVNSLFAVATIAWLGIFSEVLVTAAASTPADDTSIYDKLSAICSNKPTSEVRRISEMRELIEAAIKPNNVQCGEFTLTALRDIGPLLSDDVLRDPCTMNTVGLLREYNDKHLSKHGAGKSHTKSAEAAPRVLRNFVLTFGFQISRRCKINMINNLLQDSNRLLSSNDKSMLTKWAVRAQDFLKTVNPSPSSHEDLLLVGEIGRAMGLQFGHTDKMLIKVETVAAVRILKSSCQRRFKPIYEKLVLPAVVLANIGYSYRGEELERELLELKTNPEVHKWYMIVYLCELLEGVEAIEDVELNSLRRPGAEGRVVQILTPEQAKNVPKSKTGADDRPKIVYETSEKTLQIEDLVISPDDTNMAKLVEKFDVNSTEEERIRKKFYQRLFSFVKDSFSHLKLKFGSTFNRMSGNPDIEGRDDVVKAIDAYIGRKQDEKVKAFTIVRQNTWVDYLLRGFCVVIVVAIAGGMMLG